MAVWDNLSETTRSSILKSLNIFERKTNRKDDKKSNMWMPKFWFKPLLRKESIKKIFNVSEEIK